jgi:hypothetical protein
MDDDRQIESLSSHVLANLTVEELEQRLELQTLQLADCLYNICGVEGVCGVDGCSGLCGARCDTNCIADGCISLGCNTRQIP